jgi:hypothetical protein
MTGCLQRSSQVDELSITWSLVDRYGGVALKEVNGDKTNELQNILTASMDAHHWFGSLKIWLEAIPVGWFTLNKIGLACLSFFVG